MRNPKETDPIDRHKDAGAPTVIIGASGSSGGSGGSSGSSSGGSSNDAATVLVNVESGAARGGPPKPIPNDSGHTRIISPYINPTVSTDGKKSVDPVVGWLVVLDGPGKGNFRPIYGGNSPIGRNSNQRIPIDFGDDAISSERQASLIYDAKKRQFHLKPNDDRPNLIYLNDAVLLSSTELKAHDKITMGLTTLLFVPLCGATFDWTDNMAK